MNRKNDLRIPHTHVVAFHENDENLVQDVARFLGDGIGVGESVVVVATPEHLRAITQELQLGGFNIDDAITNDTVVMLDARRTLDNISVDGEINKDRFNQIIGSIIRRATVGGRRAVIFGEMVQLLWQDGLVGSVMELESLWNELQKELDFSLYCGYRSELIELDPNSLHSICALHTSVAKTVTPGRVALSDLTSFPVDPTSPRKARHCVTEVLQNWDMECCVDEAAMIVTELSTNAIRHAGSPFTVHVVRNDKRLRISVSDESSAAPVPQEVSIGSESGRGLKLVGEMSADWGYSPLPVGKLVWSELFINYPGVGRD